MTSWEWKVEYTHFQPEEVMAILACLATRYKYTASRVLSDARRYIITVIVF